MEPSFSKPAAVQKRLRQLIKAKGMTQDAFFDACDIPRDTGSGWLQKGLDRAPNRKSLIKIAIRMGISLDWLLLDRGEMDYPPRHMINAPQQLFDAVWQWIEDDEDVFETMRKARQKVLIAWRPETLWEVVVRSVNAIEDFAKESEWAYDNMIQWGPEQD